MADFKTALDFVQRAATQRDLQRNVGKISFRDKLGRDGKTLSAGDLRSFFDREFAVIRNAVKIKMERAGFFVHSTLQRGGRVFKDRMIKERLSAKTPLNERGEVSPGRIRVRYIKNPLSAGCREVKGNLKKSLRTTVTGASLKKQKLSGKIGGPRAPYAVIHERSGRLQFDYLFSQERDRTLGVCARGVQRIMAKEGTSAL